MFRKEGSLAMGGVCKAPKDCNNLEELFESWRDKNEENTSFVPDGFLRKKVEGKEEGCDILFISKESHEERDDNKYDDFWMKRMVTGEHKHCKNDFDKGGIVFPRHLAAIYNYFYPQKKFQKNDIISWHWDSFEERKKTGDRFFPTLENCGYMNLNKRGGGAQVSKNFAEIVKKDKAYIKRQIELMSPQKIVMLGAGLSSFLKDIEVITKTTISVFETYHPRARKTIKEYIDRIQPTLIQNKEGLFINVRNR